jgi:hypothetical protein
MNAPIYKFDRGDKVYYVNVPELHGVIINQTTCGLVNGEDEYSHQPWYEIMWDDDEVRTIGRASLGREAEFALGKREELDDPIYLHAVGPDESNPLDYTTVLESAFVLFTSDQIDESLKNDDDDDFAILFDGLCGWGFIIRPECCTLSNPALSLVDNIKKDPVFVFDGDGGLFLLTTKSAEDSIELIKQAIRICEELDYPNDYSPFNYQQKFHNQIISYY